MVGLGKNIFEMIVILIGEEMFNIDFKCVLLYIHHKGTTNTFSKIIRFQFGTNVGQLLHDKKKKNSYLLVLFE